MEQVKGDKGMKKYCEWIPYKYLSEKLLSYIPKCKNKVLVKMDWEYCGKLIKELKYE